MLPTAETEVLLRLRLRQQELLARFSGLAMQAENVQEVLDQACIIAADGLETRYAKLMQRLPDDSFLICAGIGWRPGLVGQERLGGGQASPAGYAIMTDEAVITNHLSTEQRFEVPAILTEHGIESAINVLVRAGEAPAFAVLEVDSTRRDEFSRQDVAFLQALGNVLAVAIEAQGRHAALRDALLRNQALVQEKDLLMQEVHHRVMNSLNLVRSLLSMQAADVEDETARDQLEKAAARIMSIAAVHRRLQAGGSVTEDAADNYLRGLLEGMDELLDVADPIQLDVDPFRLPASDLASLGLIVTELVTNAGKHGKHPVRVEVRQRADGLEIAVNDAGPGFGPGPQRRQGLGMRLVTALANRPDGDAVSVDGSVPHGRILVRTSFGGSQPG